MSNKSLVTLFSVSLLSPLSLAVSLTGTSIVAQEVGSVLVVPTSDGNAFNVSLLSQMFTRDLWQIFFIVLRIFFSPWFTK